VAEYIAKISLVFQLPEKRDGFICAGVMKYRLR